MATQKDIVLSNMGFKAYMSEVGVAPKMSDRLIGITGMTGFGGTANTVDATEVDGDGWTRFVATNKQITPPTLTFFKRDFETYKKLYNQFFEKETGSEAYYMDFTFIYPKKDSWSEPMSDITFTACVTSFSLGDVAVDQLQSYSITLSSQGKPKLFTGTITDTQAL